MQNSQNKKKGIFGEKLAEKYLQAKGYSILEKNWTCLWGEIDIIAQKDFKIVFVEVKYRTSSIYGSPEKAISFYKRRALFRAVRSYLLQHNFPSSQWGFEIVCLVKTGLKTIKVTHYCDVELSVC